MLTQAELKQLLHYDPETGLIYWKIARSNRIKAGQLAGTKDGCGYLGISINRKTYRNHRLIWLYMYGHFPEQVIDHIDGNKLNNKLCNLRHVSQQKNMFNYSGNKLNTSGWTGVSYDKARNKYAAYIHHNNKKVNLGRFTTAEEANKVRLQAKNRLHII